MDKTTVGGGLRGQVAVSRFSSPRTVCSRRLIYLAIGAAEPGGRSQQRIVLRPAYQRLTEFDSPQTTSSSPRLRFGRLLIIPMMPTSWKSCNQIVMATTRLRNH